MPGSSSAAVAPWNEAGHRSCGSMISANTFVFFGGYLRDAAKLRDPEQIRPMPACYSASVLGIGVEHRAKSPKVPANLHTSISSQLSSLSRQEIPWQPYQLTLAIVQCVKMYDLQFRLFAVVLVLHMPCFEILEVLREALQHCLSAGRAPWLQNNRARSLSKSSKTGSLFWVLFIRVPCHIWDLKRDPNLDNYPVVKVKVKMCRRSRVLQLLFPNSEF